MRKGKKGTPPKDFERFMAELKNLTTATQKFLLDREPENEVYAEFNKFAADSLNNVIFQVDKVQEAILKDEETYYIVNQIAAETKAADTLAYYQKTSYSETSEAATGETKKSAFLVGQDVVNKFAAYIPGPAGQAVKNLGSLLGIAAKLTTTTGDQMKRIEQKVASLQESINGVSYPEGQIEGPLPQGGKPLRDEVQEIEDKIELFFELVTGNPVPRDEDGKISKVTDEAPHPQLTGSVLWMVWELERKLEHVFTQIAGGDFPRNRNGGVIAPNFISHESSLAGEIDRICKKINNLAKLLGKTLYDTEWIVDPRAPGGMTIPQGARGPNATPPRSIKDELHDLEDMLNLILKQLKIIIDIISRPPWFPPPPEWPEIPPILPSDLKRIFVYDEGVFEGRSASDKKDILVRTGAFDLAGWLDLTDMEKGDVVLFSFFVRLPGGVRREYKSQKFSGKTDAALYKLSDIVGPGWIVGNAVDIEITLIESATGYNPPLKIPYQFVVESQ